MGFPDVKYRMKNTNGERTTAQMEKDWKDCHEYTTNSYAFNQCVYKKGYYSEQYTE